MGNSTSSTVLNTEKFRSWQDESLSNSLKAATATFPQEKLCVNADKLSIDSVKSASSKMETSRHEDSSIGIAATDSFNSDGTAVLSVQFDRKSSFLAHSNPKTSTPGRNANKPRTLDVSMASISGRRIEPSGIASSSSMTFGEESDTTALTSTISFEGSAPGSPTQLDTSESSSPATSPPRSEHRALQQKHVIDPSQVPEIRVEAEPETLYPEDIKVPILGYEVMEERAKFTVYKIQVQKTDQDVWFVFRRYSDFCHLNDQLLAQFPGIRLSLPPKRWFRSNYTREFLDDRLEGLQAFLNNVTSHGEICNSKAVREFFCFDEPPGPHDSLEESRALCETLEESVYNMRKECDEKDREISLLKEELELYRNQVTMLSKCLREVNSGRDGSLLMSPISPELSIAECDMEVSLEPEADQSHGKDDNRSPEATRETSTPIQDLPSPGKRKKRHREVPVIVHKEAEETT